MTELNVSAIQRFSTGDGPGIRTTVFLKGCNLRCPWCHNPENIRPEPQTLEYKNAGKTVSYGRMMTVDEVFADVMEDADFYRAGGGGVTLGGGEPLLQAEAAAVLLRQLKEADVSTLIDTAGCVPWGKLEAVADVTDMFYFDYKTGDDAKYRTVIGGDRALVFDNLKRLIGLGRNVHVRIPLIPGFNMSEEDCGKICADLGGIGVTHVDLLPFHRLGTSKYEALGLEYAYKNEKPSEPEIIQSIRSFYSRYFVTSTE
jgi:pyruvate formate lyase activating enzyme